MRVTTMQLARGCALLGVMLLSGCGVLGSKAEPDRIYVINAAAPAAGRAAVPGVLLVARPAVQPGLDTDRVALTRAGNELDYFAASRWGGELQQVLAAFAVQSLAGSFTTVTSADRGAGAGDFELLLTVRHFEAEYGGNATPVARVMLDCLLVTRAPRRVLGSCDADVSEPVAQNRMGSIVAALETAAQKALAQVREKVMAAAATASTPAPAPAGGAGTRR
jgi:cholesterol transport system auxiliary component